MSFSHRETLEGILLTDQYQLTMAHLYYRMGLHESIVQFDHFFRRYPDYGSHQAGYCINAGMEWLVDWMQHVHFRQQDLDFLRSQRDNAGRRIFADDFLAWLKANGRFDSLTVRAVPEGRVVHPNAPLTVVQGPLAMAQILETPLSNHLNYQTLIATKAARIADTGRNRPVLEFGLRRAQEKGGNAGMTRRAPRRSGLHLERRRIQHDGRPAQRHPRPQHGPALHDPGHGRTRRLPRLRRRLSG